MVSKDCFDSTFLVGVTKIKLKNYWKGKSKNDFLNIYNLGNVISDLRKSPESFYFQTKQR